MEKTKMTRYIVLAVLLCLIAVGTVFLVNRMPEEPFIIDRVGEVFGVVEYMGADKNLTVPEEVGGHDVGAIKGDTFAGMTDIESIMIKNNITYVGAGAFDHWTPEQTIMIEAGTDMSGWDADWNAGCNAVVMDEVQIER